jgi:outer membrane protein OmpA-like peptidoglycan-associated protein
MVRVARIFSVVLIPAMLFAQKQGEQPDHPLVSRFAGSKMVNSIVKEYDGYLVATGPEKFQTVQGKVSQYAYVAPAHKTPFEILANFQKALQGQGAQIVYTCAGGACGAFTFQNKLWGAEGNGSFTAGIGAMGPALLGAESQTTQYLCAKLSRNGAVTYVAVWVAQPEANTAHDFWHSGNDQDVYVVTVIEPKAMAEGQVTVDARAMSDALQQTGHIALYNIYFDTDKADLKPESDPALQEIQKLLSANPRLSLFVVGHTDSTGDFDHNMDLSRRRAAAVRDALITRMHVSASRLTSNGVGPLSPVASNDAEAGRAKNRRVELVKR